MSTTVKDILFVFVRICQNKSSVHHIHARTRANTHMGSVNISFKHVSCLYEPEEDIGKHQGESHS